MMWRFCFDCFGRPLPLLAFPNLNEGTAAEMGGFGLVGAGVPLAPVVGVLRISRKNSSSRPCCNCHSSIPKLLMYEAMSLARANDFRYFSAGGRVTGWTALSTRNSICGDGSVASAIVIASFSSLPNVDLRHRGKIFEKSSGGKRCNSDREFTSHCYAWVCCYHWRLFCA